MNSRQIEPKIRERKRDKRGKMKIRDNKKEKVKI
jgi:hypothetical protein